MNAQPIATADVERLLEALGSVLRSRIKAFRSKHSRNPHPDSACVIERAEYLRACLDDAIPEITEALEVARAASRPVSDGEAIRLTERFYAIADQRCHYGSGESPRDTPSVMQEALTYFLHHRGVL